MNQYRERGLCLDNFKNSGAGMFVIIGIVIAALVFVWIKNKKQPKSKAVGSSSYKFDIDTMYFNYIKSDGININNDGFFWKSHGRTAIIYFVENSSVVPIDVEMPGVDYLDALVFGETEHIRKRYYPTNTEVQDLSQEDRIRIQRQLAIWLNDRGTRHDIRVEEVLLEDKRSVRAKIDWFKDPKKYPMNVWLRDIIVNYGELKDMTFTGQSWTVLVRITSHIEDSWSTYADVAFIVDEAPWHLLVKGYSFNLWAGKDIATVTIL